LNVPALSVVVPVFDESALIAGSLSILSGALGRLGLDFEIVCVDDGSRDDSLVHMRSAAKDDARIRVIALGRNRGKGAAVRAGVLAARAPRIAFMDADLSTGLERLPVLLAGLDAGCHVVVGNRRAPGSRLLVRQPWLREKMGGAFGRLSRTLLCGGIEDFTCGFKAFRAESARAIFTRTRVDRWAFDAEILVIARDLDLAVAQVPVAWSHARETKVRLVRAATGALYDLGRIVCYRAAGCYRRESSVRAPIPAPEPARRPG
jgi:glycosyltransferase involved in cell wall biosynthesis